MKAEIIDDLLSKLSCTELNSSKWRELQDSLEHWSCRDKSVLEEKSDFWNGPGETDDPDC